MTSDASVQMTASDEDFLDQLARNSMARADWLRIGVLYSVRLALDVAQLSFKTSDAVLRSFSRPEITVQLQSKWHSLIASMEDGWERGEREELVSRRYRDRRTLLDAVLRYANWFMRFKTLRMLTDSSTMRISLGRQQRLFSADIFASTVDLSQLERDEVLAAAFRPAYLGAFLSASQEPISDSAFCKAARNLSHWDTEVALGAQAFPIRLFALVEPFVCDDDQRAAYFPLKISLAIPRDRLEAHNLWSADNLELIWKQLQEQVNCLLEEYGEYVPRHRAPLEPTDLTPIISPQTFTPRWDAALRTLLLGEHVIKHFKQPAQNQETVLAAFEDEGWPRRIDDPLRPNPDIVPKVRLRETVKALNDAHRINGLISFEMDGTGEGVVHTVLS